jgi:hypothetical protein
MEERRGDIRYRKTTRRRKSMKEMKTWCFMAMLTMLLALTACGGGSNNNNAGNNDVKTPSISILPKDQSREIKPDGTVDPVTLTVTATNTGITWPEKSGDTANYMENADGKSATWTPPATPGLHYFVVKATADTSKTATVTVTVTSVEPKPTIAINPLTQTIHKGDLYAFNAEVVTPEGQTAQITKWEVSGGIGTIDENGLFAANNEGDGSIAAYIYSNDGKDKITASIDFTVASALKAVSDEINASEVVGAMSIEVHGNNDNGQIAGSFDDVAASGNYTKGFILNRDNEPSGMLTVMATATSVGSFSIPGATRMNVLDINNAGTVVGDYYDGSHTHGFVRYADGSIETIDIPFEDGSIWDTTIYSIDDSGVIVGDIVNDGWTDVRGFVKDGGSIKYVSLSSGNYTVAYSVNTHGQMVGYFYADAGRSGAHGYLQDGDVTHVIDYPGAQHTQVTGINDQKVIVGWYGLDGETAIHGFLKDGARWRSFDLPGIGAYLTINNSGVIVGYTVEYRNGRFETDSFELTLE